MQVFNPARVLVYETGRPLSSITGTARLLETDSAARAAFFAQPILVPSAGKWVANWCTQASALIKTAFLAHPLLRHRVLIADSL
jgi:hypothetical protein